ncbi:MAG: exodeoxyribonuclease VII large subunit [Bacilli bacterium]|nr:exodeoxyribonuclease VII large subunit [Bacilli bacterium]
MNDYITVGALTRYIKYRLDNDPNLQEVCLKGEISNFKKHTRGHFYFTIKDEESRISAIMFASNASKVNFEVQDGMKVLVKGKVTVFEQTGNYQIYVSEIKEDGIGNLFELYEKLKKDLEKEGLFKVEHKKPIPKIPNRIGVITAPTGAAVRDIMSTINRRYPLCEVILFPSLVQGKDAKDDIVKNIKLADSYNLDVIICGRGGGSIEDLWAFNEEIVARVIYECNTPIISAVGHEIDFTIADFVADKRAETPTAAAEMCAPSKTDLINLINQLEMRLNKNINSLITNNKLILHKLMDSYILKNPMSIYEVKEEKLSNDIDKLNNYIKVVLDKKNDKYNHLVEKLDVLNPLNTLKRGYSITKKDNIVISSVKGIKSNDILEINLNDGSIITSVKEVKEN